MTQQQRWKAAAAADPVKPTPRQPHVYVPRPRCVVAVATAGTSLPDPSLALTLTLTLTLTPTLTLTLTLTRYGGCFISEFNKPYPKHWLCDNCHTGQPDDLNPNPITLTL